MTEQTLRCLGPTCTKEDPNGKDKPASEFHNDARSKTGKQKYCKECNKDKQRDYRAGKLTSRKVKAKAKMEALTKELSEGTSTVAEAYNKISGCTNMKSAAAAASRFIHNLDKDIVEEFKETLKTSEHFEEFFKYLETVRHKGQFADQRDAWKLYFEVTELIKGKNQAPTTAPTEVEDKLAKMAEFIQRTTKKTEE